MEFFNTLDNPCQFETMDYIKKLETSAMGYIIIGIIVFFMYCLYQSPILSIITTVFVGSEALAIFGVRKKKTIPIYFYIVLNVLISLLYLLVTCGCVYNYLTEGQMAGIDYRKIGFILIIFMGFAGFLTKAVNAIKAVKMMNEERHGLVPLFSNLV